MATVRDILRNKGTQVHTVPASATVLEATQQMNEAKIGAMVVTRDERVIGIFSERDVLRRVVAEQRALADTFVGDVMVKDVICCAPGTALDEASRIMKDCRIRHLPVCDNEGHLHGLISIGDLNAYHASDKETTIHYLNEYLFGQ